MPSDSSPSQKSALPATIFCRVLTATTRLAPCRARPRHMARPAISIFGAVLGRAAAAYMAGLLSLFNRPVLRLPCRRLMSWQPIFGIVTRRIVTLCDRFRNDRLAAHSRGRRRGADSHHVAPLPRRRRLQGQRSRRWPRHAPCDRNRPRRPGATRPDDARRGWPVAGALYPPKIANTDYHADWQG